jgi:hypothetical protein
VMCFALAVFSFQMYVIPYRSTGVGGRLLTKQ